MNNNLINDLFAFTLVSEYDMADVNEYIGKLFANIGRLIYQRVDDGVKVVYHIEGVESHHGQTLKLTQVQRLVTVQWCDIFL